MSHHYGLPLTAKVSGGKLTIEIGTHTLAHAIAYADWANPWNDRADDYIRTFAISDPTQFATDVLHAMQDEREDGSTPLSDFLDKMAEAAIDDGSTGVECDQRIKHGTFSPLERWASEVVEAGVPPPPAPQEKEK